MNVAAIMAVIAVLLTAGVSAGEEPLPFDLRHYGSFKGQDRGVKSLLDSSCRK
jgi:hypothetical protein